LPQDEEFIKELQLGFGDEAEQLMQAASKDLMDLEEAAGDALCRAEAYASLARNLHTLKGSAATCSLDEISDLAHRMEGALASLKADCLPLPHERADLLLEAMDSIRAELKARAAGQDISAIEQLRASLLNRLAAESSEAPARLSLSAAAVGATHASPQQEPTQEQDWRVERGRLMEMISQAERLHELSASLLRRGLKEDGELASEISSSLEESLKAACTAPLHLVFDPLRRSLRELCRRLGKAAQLSQLGGEIRADRRVLEALRGALGHLLRNAVDHGIEAPEERDRLGKHHEGSLVLRAEIQGNRLFVEVSDDGAGIDPERLRKAAAKQGIASESELANWDERRLLELPFRPGFSMAGKVTELSGRGVGLDAVRRGIASLGGGVELESRPGQGTRFILTLPMELGTAPVLLLRCGSQNFGLPLLAVESVAKLSPGLLQLDGRRSYLRHRERACPLRDLAELLELRPASAPRLGQPLLVLSAAGRQAGLLVDEVLGSAELALKPLPGCLASLRAYQGVSQDPGGEPLLILRQEWLADPALGESAGPGRRRALVVDDSMTARALQRAVLESAGYQVNIAGSGEEALALLSLARYDVALCDVGMRGMDGFAFVRELRRKPELGGLPVLMVSGVAEPALRERALLAGAQGYLSKKDCASGRLLDEIAAVFERGRVPA
jgi:chemotaxis protein histidine kinase CheA/CheY-like chemotaxis protein